MTFFLFSKELSSSLFRVSFVTCAAALCAVVGFDPSAAQASPINLGAAAGYAAIAINSFQFNGPGTINGNVAVGQSTNFASPAVINGTVYENPTVPAQGNITPTGGFVHTDLTPVFAAAQAAAVTASGLSPTQTLGAIGDNATITGSAGQNVIDVSDISMSNGVLTLAGTPTSTFIINDTGGFKSSNSDIVLSGGVQSSNILFNITGNVSITGGGGNNFYGVFLAPNSDISVHDKTLFGEIIGNTIEDTSGFQIFAPPPPPVPEPQTYSIAALGLLLLGGFAWRRRAKRVSA